MTATSSSRLSLWYGIPLMLLCVLVAAPFGPTRLALAGATVASPSPGEPCEVNELDLSSPLNPVPTVYAPGQVGTKQATLRNPTSVAFTDAYFDFQLVAPPNTTEPPTAPTMSWSIDGKHWPGLSLSWVGPRASQTPYWQSDDIALPTLAAGSTHTLRFQAAFHADSPTGFYTGILTIGARACFAVLGTTSNITYDYVTELGRTGCCAGHHGGSSNGGAGAGRPAARPPTAPVSAAPSASPASPAPTGSVTTVIVAAPTPNRSSGASATHPSKIARLGALLVLVVAALAGLWRQVVNLRRARSGPR